MAFRVAGAETVGNGFCRTANCEGFRVAPAARGGRVESEESEETWLVLLGVRLWFVGRRGPQKEEDWP